MSQDVESCFDFPTDLILSASSFAAMQMSSWQEGDPTFDVWFNYQQPVHKAGKSKQIPLQSLSIHRTYILHKHVSQLLLLMETQSQQLLFAVTFFSF